MPIQSVRLKPGVDLEQTFTLNEAGVITTQLCRIKDGLYQAMGGWTRWLASTIAAPPRALMSWIDLTGAVYTAIGTDAGLYVVPEATAVVQDMTPSISTVNVAPNLSTVAGSSTVTITDPNGIPLASAVTIVTPVTVGGLLLAGTYQIESSTGAFEYTITAVSTTTAAYVATSTETNAGQVPVYSVQGGNSTVNVYLPGHGQYAGSQWEEPLQVTLGNLTIYGSYLVRDVVDADNFTLTLTANASASASVAENNGLLRLTYYVPGPGQISDYGYGVGGYGLGGYGEGSAYVAPPTVAPSGTAGWTLDHWGEALIACAANGPMFSWTPRYDTNRMSIIPTAPTVSGGIFIVAAAQILVAWRTSINGVVEPNLVAWSTQSDYTQWNASVTTLAGNYVIPTGSTIMGATQSANIAYIFTDVDVYSMTYLGDAELVFSFVKMADGCGLIAQRACNSFNDVVYWMTPGGKFMRLASGYAPATLDCPVWDQVFQDLDTANADKIVCATNTIFDEVMWYFPSKSGGTGENDSYVKYNALYNAWDVGKLARSAWQDYSPVGNPIGATAAGVIYQHETGITADGQPLNWSLSSGAFMIADGDQMMFVDWLLPDFKYGFINDPSTNSNVSVTVSTYRYANDAPVVSPTLTCTPSGNGSIALRARGRAMQVALSGTGFFRLGNLRFRAAPDGRY